VGRRGSTEDGRLVLIVDDEADIARLIQMNLVSAGYRCVIAVDGVQALSLLARGSFDAVTTGLTLPRMDGFELIRRIRANPATVDLPIVIVSALSKTADKRTGLGLGADDYLTKPFDPAELVRHMEVLWSLPRDGARRDPGFDPSTASDERIAEHLDGICRSAGCR
jgi:DNA-binding response OmpR family regulator